jgi:PilZ domain
MPPGGVRHSGRIPEEIAIVLLGSDTDDREFTEQTKTVVLTRHGAGIISKHKLAPDQEMIIRCLGTNKEGEVRVVGQIGSQSEGYIYGVVFLDPRIELWELKFPPLPESEKEANLISLECNSCRDREVVDLDDLELDVIAINQGIVRNCKHCRVSTVWKPAQGETNGKLISTKTEQKPEPEVTPILGAHPENRRRYVRTTVNLAACIRCPGLNDRIVVCESMSLGGLGFRSRERYFEKSMIEVAVPYSPRTPSIFVPAQIVYVRGLPEGRDVSHGVAYMRLPKDLREI